MSWYELPNFSNAVPLTIFPLPNTDLPLYAEISDKAGNTTLVSDTIRFVSAQPLPSSNSYKLCGFTVDSGGGSKQSTSYNLVSSTGIAFTDNSSSTGTVLSGGLLSGVGSCWTHASPAEVYQVLQSVLASAGGLRSSASFRLGGTFGQPFDQAGISGQSASYRFYGGFWSANNQQVPPYHAASAFSIPQEPVVPAPLPTSPAQPVTFQILIDNGAAYTNSRTLDITVQAPNVSEMQISASKSTQADLWVTYQPNFIWNSLGQNQTIEILHLNAWFRNQQGEVFGPYTAEITYDPVAPEGIIVPLDSRTTNQSFWVDATDIGSGIAAMRYNTNPALDSSPWVPLASYIENPPAQSEIFIQFRDYAGNMSPVYSLGTLRYFYLPVIKR